MSHLLSNSGTKWSVVAVLLYFLHSGELTAVCHKEGKGKYCNLIGTLKQKLAIQHGHMTLLDSNQWHDEHNGVDECISIKVQVRLKC